MPETSSDAASSTLLATGSAPRQSPSSPAGRSARRSWRSQSWCRRSGARTASCSPARDGRFFRRAARVNAAHVPGPALWMQGLWASLLALSGRYGDLLDYVIIAELIFYLLTVGGLFVLVRRQGEPLRGAWYPWLQIAYLAIVGALVGVLL